VQSEAAPAAYRSWRAHALLEDETRTFAEGLATRTACALTQGILWEHLDDFALVTDDELRACTLHMIELTRNLVEPSGAAPLAAALRLRERLKDKSIALICSGGNISPSQLAKLLASNGATSIRSGRSGTSST
jgi:threonine dehydratase